MGHQRGQIHTIFGFLLVLFLGAGGTGNCSFSIASSSDSTVNSPLADTKKQSLQDAYYKVEGPVVGPRAPRLTEASYPTEFGESRVVVWIVAQQHL